MKLFAISSLVLVLAEGTPLSGSRLESRQSLPTLKLPYGTWEASKYDRKHDIYVFKNIRFAAPPLGQLRWAKPAPPEKNDTLQTGHYGPACFQTLPVQSATGGGFFGDTLSYLVDFLNFGKLSSSASEVSEDCLFLDLYVPGKALNGSAKLPIANWIYGGAYIFGSKEQYDGIPIIARSDSNLIHVLANYRVAAFGFLAGDTVEKEATPNAGLWDQRAVLEWIQKFAPLFGGDAENVTVWGESAGAGSIMHHLTAFGGQKPALFKRAIAQSPAADMYLDRQGMLEKEFRRFANLAGCDTQGSSPLACLRSASFDRLRVAQDRFFADTPDGKPGFGPAADGDFVRQLPVLEFASGNIVKGVEAVITSHVKDEAKLFAPTGVTETKFNELLDYFFASSPKIKAAVRQKYASLTILDKRMHDFVGHSTFNCHSRWLLEAFSNKTYSIQYGRGPGLHGIDIGADFLFEESRSMWDVQILIDNGLRDFAPTYQKYMASLMTTGNPNTHRDPTTPEWPIAELGPSIKKVVDITDDGYGFTEDHTNTAEWCDFLKDALAGMTASLGLSPPGAVVKSTVIGAASDPSGKYKSRP